MFDRDSGADERSIGYEPLPPEIRSVVIQSWRNFGLLAAATVEQMVPAVGLVWTSPGWTGRAAKLVQAGE